VRLLFLMLSALVAAIPFGLVVTSLFGGDEDLRTHGSGNIGATNVARVYGWRLAGTVIALDMAKGFLPVAIARWMWPEDDIWFASLTMVTCVLAHCFPPYLDFRGGKGVATGAGGLLALSPYVTVPAVGAWIAILGVTGMSSVAALGATVAAFLVAFTVHPDVLPAVALLGIVIIATHVPNIRRLLRGDESTIIRPVRWGRGVAQADDVSALLQQGPGGGPAPPSWREEKSEPG
jgi:glycerol-3-phosphate acyltransferase PlsY